MLLGRLARVADEDEAVLAGIPHYGSIVKYALSTKQTHEGHRRLVDRLFSSLDFTNNMMTCPVGEGANAFIKEGECVWAKVNGRFYDQGTTSQTLGFDESAFQVSGGAQFALGDVWRLGTALGYEHSTLATDPDAQSNGDRVNGGAVLKYNPGPLLLAAAVSGGWGWYDTNRQIDFAGFDALATAHNDIGNIDERFRAAYLFTNGIWYLKPQVDLDATELDLNGVNEHGGSASLIIKGNNDTVFSASPALELGGQFQWSNGALVRPFVRGGVTVFNNTDFALDASFEGAPSGVGSFRIATGIDNVLADVSAGVQRHRHRRRRTQTLLRRPLRRPYRG